MSQLHAGDENPSFGFLVRDVARLNARYFEACASGLGLTLPQCKVLSTLSHHQGIHQVRLAELSETEPMTLVRILDRMEANGWTERRPDPHDRRARCVYLRRAAHPILRQIAAIAEAAQAEIFSTLLPAEQATLMKLMLRVHGRVAQLAELEPPAAPKRVLQRRRLPGPQPPPARG